MQSSYDGKLCYNAVYSEGEKEAYNGRREKEREKEGRGRRAPGFIPRVLLRTVYLIIKSNRSAARCLGNCFNLVSDAR